MEKLNDTFTELENHLIARLSDITDANNLAYPQDNDILAYGSSLGKWINAMGGGSSSGNGDGHYLPSAFPSSYSYIIFIDPRNNIVKARNGTTGNIDYATASAPANSTDTRMLFNNVFAAIQDTGGMVFVRNGLYKFSGGSVIVGNSTTRCITMQGESRDGTEFRLDDHVGYRNGMFRIQSNCNIDSIHFNGDYADTGGVGTILVYMNWSAYLRVCRCRFQRGNGIMLYNAGASLGEVVANNWYGENNGHDQHSEGCQEFAIITHNLYDRRTATAPYGTTGGSCQTNGGSAKNILIANNVYLRKPNESGGENAISLESWGVDHSHYLITGNVCDGGRIFVGGQNITHAGKDNNIMITNNQLHGGPIMIDSGNEWPNTDISHIQIIGNTMYKSNWGGIMILEVNGPVSIRNNTVIESNYHATPSTSRGCIYLTHANDVDISNNTIIMTDMTPNVSPYALRIHGGCTNIRFFGNKIKNTTGNNTFILETSDGSNSNIKLWDNEGYITNADDVTHFSGDSTTMAFKIIHGLAVTPTNVEVSTNQNILARVSAISSSSFTVTFASAPPSGINNVSIYWRASKRIFA